MTNQKESQEVTKKNVIDDSESEASDVTDDQEENPVEEKPKRKQPKRKKQKVNINTDGRRNPKRNSKKRKTMNLKLIFTISKMMEEENQREIFKINNKN